MYTESVINELLPYSDFERMKYNTIQYNDLMNTPQGGFTLIIYNK